MSAPVGSLARTIIDRAMRRDRLAHAILLSGKSQPALEKLALEVAAQLLDWQPTGEGTSVATFSDFFALRPSKKARQISADDTRELIRRIQHSPQIGDRKVAVIFEADRQNLASANIFLKTLEEPPLDTTILLLTTRPYALLATIRSRCLHIRVADTVLDDSDPAIRDWLQAYRQWLDQLVDRTPAKEMIPELILRLYALVRDFKANLDRVTKQAVSAQEGTEGEPVSEEEIEALEAGLAISIRDGVLAGIEETTCRFARDLAEAGRGELAARLPAAIESLEEINGLLRVYFPVANAIEQFLLTSLRLWTAPR